MKKGAGARLKDVLHKGMVLAKATSEELLIELREMARYEEVVYEGYTFRGQLNTGVEMGVVKQLVSRSEPGRVVLEFRTGEEAGKTIEYSEGVMMGVESMESGKEALIVVRKRKSRAEAFREVDKFWIFG